MNHRLLFCSFWMAPVVLDLTTILSGILAIAMSALAPRNRLGKHFSLPPFHLLDPLSESLSQFTRVPLSQFTRGIVQMTVMSTGATPAYLSQTQHFRPG